MISIEEYRLSYPRTSPVPTITQIGALAGALELHKRKSLLRAQRQAARRRWLAVPGKTIGWLAQAFAATGPRPAAVTTFTSHRV